MGARQMRMLTVLEFSVNSQAMSASNYGVRVIELVQPPGSS